MTSKWDYYTNRPMLDLADLILPQWQCQWTRSGKEVVPAEARGKVRPATDKRQRDYIQGNLEGNTTRFVESKTPGVPRLRQLTKLDGELFHQQNRTAVNVHLGVDIHTCVATPDVKTNPTPRVAA